MAAEQSPGLAKAGAALGSTGIAGALTIIVLYFLDPNNEHPIPPLVAAAIQTIVTSVIGTLAVYLIPPRVSNSNPQG